jgi:hypothetical protein
MKGDYSTGKGNFLNTSLPVPNSVEYVQDAARHDF